LFSGEPKNKVAKIKFNFNLFLVVVMQLENKNEMDREKWVNKMQVMHKFATETGTRN